MAVTVAISEARRNLRAFVAAAAAGEQIIITINSIPVAQITRLAAGISIPSENPSRAKESKNHG